MRTINFLVCIILFEIVSILLSCYSEFRVSHCAVLFEIDNYNDYTMTHCLLAVVSRFPCHFILNSIF